MKIYREFSFENELHYIAGLSLLLAMLIVLGNYDWLFFPRVIIGLAFLLFFPGYTLIVCLFPRKSDLGTIERLTISSGLSVIICMLLGLVLNYTLLGIRLIPLLSLIGFFNVVFCCVAIHRRKKLPPSERYIPVLSISLSEFKEKKLVERIISVILSILLLFTIGSMLYIVVTPKAGEGFTEFYVLGQNGKADGYPQSLAVGEKGRVIVGIVNREHRSMSYRLQVNINGYVKSNIGSVSLDDQKKWEETVEFSATEPNEKARVDFLLFRVNDNDPDHPVTQGWFGQFLARFTGQTEDINEGENENTPYRTLNIWVNVHK